MTALLHARGIVIAGALAALALALGSVTLAMNQTASQAAPQTIVPLKDRGHSAASLAAAKKAAATKAAAKLAAAKAKKKVALKRPDPNLVAALEAGLPRSVAEALARRPVVVVELWSKSDPVGKLSLGEAQAGSALAGAAFVGINVDLDGGAAGVLTTALGKIPDAPAALVYTRPATLSLTLPGFNDRTVVQQAVQQATTKPEAVQSSTAGSSTTPAATLPEND
jgi:hypothetical protein